MVCTEEAEGNIIHVSVYYIFFIAAKHILQIVQETIILQHVLSFKDNDSRLKVL